MAERPCHSVERSLGFSEVAVHLANHRLRAICSFVVDSAPLETCCLCIVSTPNLCVVKTAYVAKTDPPLST
eukprot:5196915-Amphidinium_carterae.1